MTSSSSDLLLSSGDGRALFGGGMGNSGQGETGATDDGRSGDLAAFLPTRRSEGSSMQKKQLLECDQVAPLKFHGSIFPYVLFQKEQSNIISTKI